MRWTAAQIEEVRRLVGGKIRLDVPLSTLTSFRIGGPADVVAEPQSVAELGRLLRFARENAIPSLALGAGTNVLFHDAGFRGLIVRTKSLESWQVHSNGSDLAVVEVAAGVSLPLVVSRLSRLGWTGLEPLWGIPGSFGGAVVTNAGAGGASIADFLVSLRLIDAAGKEFKVGNADLHFSYRSAAIPPAAVAVGGILRLHRDDPNRIAERLDHARSLRKSTQPVAQPSAGCVFKNPAPENPAGAVIDRLGFKGTSVGGAMVSDVHANFIVNRGNASAADVLRLIDSIRSRAKAEAGIDLVLEIRVIGESDS